MTFFTDERRPARSRQRRSVRVGRWLLVVGIVALLGLSFLPAPYAIERPGPVFNTLGDVTIGDGQQPLISIPDETTYPTDGSLSMLTVNVLGNREQHPNWIEVVGAWADPSEAVVPIDALFPEGETVEQSNEASEIDMQNSQKDAIAASLSELGYQFSVTLTVSTFSPDSPAEGVLEEGDQVVSLNGTAPANLTELRSLIATNGTDTPASVGVIRNGSPQTVDVSPVLVDGSDSPILGIGVTSDYDFPFDVKIQLENVGGPSAGMMFALGIIDKLTPGELNGGADVAGTGTITSDGAVGPIGGIRQKLYGAKNAGATVFLAPADNCNEVVGHIPDGLSVYRVATLEDSLAVLSAIADDVDTSILPTCSSTP